MFGGKSLPTNEKCLPIFCHQHHLNPAVQTLVYSDGEVKVANWKRVLFLTFFDGFWNRPVN